MWPILVQSALAWDVNIADWSGQDAPVDEPFELNTASFEAVAPADEVEAAYQRALDVWNAESGADLYVEYGGRSTTTWIGDGDDGHNVNVFGSSTGDDGFAVSTWGYIGDDTNDCDTQIYRSNRNGTIDWYVGTGTAGDGTYDLQQTFTHELGHCLGLGHTDVDGAMSARPRRGSDRRRRALRPARDRAHGS